MKHKTIKRILLSLLITAVLGSLAALSVSAETWEIQHPHSMEDIVLHAELRDGVMTLKIVGDRRGNVTLSEFTMAKLPWKDFSYRNKIKEVYFGTGIRDLDGLDMCYFDSVEILHIPSYVTSLGRGFSMMMKLKTIYYGGTKSAWEALSEGIDLRQGTPLELTVICESGDSSRECDESWEVGYPNKSDVIASRAGDTLYIEGRGMMQNYALTTNGIDDLAPWAANMDIKHVIICDGVRNIGDYAFFINPSIEDITIAGSVTVIGTEALYNLDITQLRIPASVTALGERALAGCDQLQAVYLTQNIDSLGNDVFDGCSRLTDIYYYGAKYYWDSIDCHDSNDALKHVSITYNYAAPGKDGTIDCLPFPGGTGGAVRPGDNEPTPSDPVPDNTVKVWIAVSAVLGAAVIGLAAALIVTKKKAKQA